MSVGAQPCQEEHGTVGEVEVRMAPRVAMVAKPRINVSELRGEAAFAFAECKECSVVKFEVGECADLAGAE